MDSILRPSQDHVRIPQPPLRYIIYIYRYLKVQAEISNLNHSTTNPPQNTYNFAAGPTAVISLYSKLQPTDQLLIATSKAKRSCENSRRQKIRILLPRDLVGKVLRCQPILVAFRGLGRQLVRLLPEELLRISFVDLLAFGRRHAVATPLPQLAAADFCRGGVFLEQSKPKLFGIESLMGFYISITMR